MTLYMQECFPPLAADANAETLYAQAQARLRQLKDNEAKSIFGPLESPQTLASSVESAARNLRAAAKHLVVIGSGGSGLNGKVFSSLQTEGSTHQLHVVDSCDVYAADKLMAALEPQACALLLVSKSGTTVETLAYADLFCRWMEKTPDAVERIAVITMPNDNALHQHARKVGWTCIAHDEHLCGRFSILSPVGLLPAAFLGMDISNLLEGAKMSWQQPVFVKDAVHMQYEASQKGQRVHVCFTYGERFAALTEWWRQSFAESLGKNQKGMFPICAQGTRDQHSQLQLYLDGPAIAIFTLLTETCANKGPVIGNDVMLPALAGHRIGEIIASQQMATFTTLKNAGKSVRHLALASHDMKTVGYLLCQWMQEIITLGYMFGINPFDQPAVEESKRLAREFLNSSS